MAVTLTPCISGNRIKRRIAKLAEQISADYAGKVSEENPLLILCTLCGAVFFAADLIRKITVPCEMDFLKLHSYEGTRPVGSPIFDLGEQIPVSGRNVLIVEDIVDTGQTMDTVIRNFADKGAAGIEICTMLDKPSRRLDALKETLKVRYIGFEVEDLFIVGWGLDYNDRYRLLPDIMIYSDDKTAKKKKTKKTGESA